MLAAIEADIQFANFDLSTLKKQLLIDLLMFITPKIMQLKQRRLQMFKGGFLFVSS